MGPPRFASRLLRSASGALGALGRQRPADRALFARAWCTVLWCSLRLRYPRLLRGQALLWREARRDAARPLPKAGPEARLLEIFAQAVDAQPLGVSCLPRSLALKRYLRRQGIESRLHLGVRRADGGLSGHAWLERGGAVIGDRESFVRSHLPFERRT